MFSLIVLSRQVQNILLFFPMASMMPFDGDDQMSTVEQKLGTGFHISINLSILYTYYID